VSALPRPDLPPGAHRDLVEALHDLHHRAGWPSLRTLAKAAGCSHTTVSAVFSSARLPAWGVVELIVEDLDGDVAEFHKLWLEAGAEGSNAPPAPRLAGRSEELVRVRRHLEARTGLLVVTGEAGIGKSRLVSAAIEAADPHVALGSCLPLSQAVPLMPVADALTAAWAADRGSRVEALLANGPAYLRSGLGRLIPELEGGSGREPDQRHIFLAVERLLAGPNGRLALVLDDLHWADPATLDLIEHLVARQAPVTLLGTWRLEDPLVPSHAQGWWERMRRLPATTTLALGPLDRAGTVEQVEQLGVATPGFADRVFARSGGQPLFTEQLAVHGGDDLPELLGDLLNRRLGELGADAERVATWLGVADRPLSGADLAALSGLDDERTASALHELASRYLLATPTMAVALRHPLLAEAARHRLLPHERQAAHRGVAMLLGETGAPAAEVAEHCRAAGDAEQELAWRERAARAAAARGATGQAASAWLRVLELWPDDGSRDVAEHADALVQAMTCLYSSRGLDRAGELVPRALALVPELLPSSAAPLLANVGHVRGALEGPEQALGLLRRAVALYEGLPASADHVRALAQLSGELRGMARYDEARELIGRAVDVSEQVGDGNLLRTQLELLAWHETLAGDAVAAAATRARADAVTGNQFDLVWIGVVRTDALLVSCAPCDEVEWAAGPGLALAREEGISSMALTLLQSNTAQALVQAGRTAAAYELLEPTTHTQPGVDTWPVFVEWVWLLCLRGDLDRAAELLPEILAIPITSVVNAAERAERAAAIELWRGNPADARRLLSDALNAISDGPGSLRAGALLSLLAWATADLVGGRGSSDVAESVVRARLSLFSDPLAADAVMGDHAAQASRWDAELSRLRGNPDPALWAAAALEWDRLDRPHDAAYCRGAQAALDMGQGTVARRLLKRAATDAREHVPLTRAIAETGAYAEP
jgi:tetratricopeptide (TPR) repeat protein